MPSFKDSTGRTWQVDLNVSSMKRVKSLTGTDLANVVADNGDLLRRLSGDPATICDVCYAICKPQADAAGVSDEDFGSAFDGDTIAAAADALAESIVLFTPNTKARDLLRKVSLANQRVRAKGLEMIADRMSDKQIDAAMKQEIDKLASRLDVMFGGSFTSLPAPSA